MKTDMCKFESS